jgi:NAD(P)-dependent dehydrogenase (short-subunit alcohol dehydrogenase family)
VGTEAVSRLQGKVAIVSGSYSGIGRAVARRLASEGARVVLANSNQQAGEAAAASIRDVGEAVALPFDLSDEASIVSLMSATRERFGGLSVLCNNAAITRGPIMDRDSAVHDLPNDVWQRVLAVNTTGTLLMIKHALPLLIEAHDSAIINIGSGAALSGDVFRPSYAASKAAIDSLTRSVATQYGKVGVRCNVVSPGMIVTDNALTVHTEQSLAMIERHTLTPYLGRAEDIAAMVALLASDEGRFVTGQIICVDGGYLSHFAHVADSAAHFWSVVDEQTGV